MPQWLAHPARAHYRGLSPPLRGWPRALRLSVRTPDFQSGNQGSTPCGITIIKTRVDDSGLYYGVVRMLTYSAYAKIYARR